MSLRSFLSAGAKRHQSMLLLHACANNCIDDVQKLLNSSADINDSTSDGTTPSNCLAKWLCRNCKTLT
jgi:ankyrin repeat protein